MAITFPKHTAKSRVRDEVEHFAGLYGAPLDPRRFSLVHRLLTQVMYASGTGIAIGVFWYAVVAIKAAVSQ